MLILLWLILLGRGSGLLLPAGSSLMSVPDLVGVFILGCSNAVAASTACRVTDRWFPPHFSLLSTFGIDGWSAEVSCPIVRTWGLFRSSVDDFWSIRSKNAEAGLF